MTGGLSSTITSSKAEWSTREAQADDKRTAAERSGARAASRPKTNTSVDDPTHLSDGAKPLRVRKRIQKRALRLEHAQQVDLASQLLHAPPRTLTRASSPSSFSDHGLFGASRAVGQVTTTTSTTGGEKATGGGCGDAEEAYGEGELTGAAAAVARARGRLEVTADLRVEELAEDAVRPVGEAAQRLAARRAAKEREEASRLADMMEVIAPSRASSGVPGGLLSD